VTNMANGETPKCPLFPSVAGEPLSRAAHGPTRDHSMETMTGSIPACKYLPQKVFTLGGKLTVGMVPGVIKIAQIAEARQARGLPASSWRPT
jgi:hypothetical protein